MEWVSVNGINTPETMKLLDLGERDEAARSVCLHGEDLFPDPSLRARFDALPLPERLKVIELMTRPTGFTLVAGRGASLGRMMPRVAGNAVPVAELARAGAGIFRV